jgi:hypothetical protein
MIAKLVQKLSLVAVVLLVASAALRRLAGSANYQ